MSDWIKLADLFFSFVVGQKNIIGEKSLELSADILNQMRRVFILIVLMLGSLILFCMGMSYLIERLLHNLDQGPFIMTPSIWFILGFQAVCLIVLVYSTQKDNWLKIFKDQEKSENKTNSTSTNNGSQIESVISLLILDIVKEREFKREQQKNSSVNKGENERSN